MWRLEVRNPSRRKLRHGPPTELRRLAQIVQQLQRAEGEGEQLEQDRMDMELAQRLVFRFCTKAGEGAPLSSPSTGSNQQKTL